MPVNKVHDEFHSVDMDSGWTPAPGYAPSSGVKHKILSGDLDEDKRSGTRTRLLHLPAGVYTTTQFAHDYWEEVFLVSGDLTVGNDEHGDGGVNYQGYTYAVRPPHALHGPFKSNGGCILLETHYYDPV